MRLMMGFMLTTSFFSMWMSNTATAAMITPIVEAVIQKISLKSNPEVEVMLDNGNVSVDCEVEILENSAKEKEVNIQQKKMVQDNSSVRTAFLLCVCYSANIGGTGSLMGTGPNIIFKGLMEELHPESHEITFSTWMMYNIPGLILCVFLAWICLYLVYIKHGSYGMGSHDEVKEIIVKRYQSLGNVSFSEKAVSVLFIILVLLWMFRAPKFVTGWAEAVSDVKIGSSVPAMLVSCLLFWIPSNPRQFRKSPPILEWSSVQQKLPWGVLILFGGGFALADGAQKSGLSALMRNKMSSLSILPPGAIVTISCFMTAMLTEFVSNPATATVLLPLYNQMALTIGVNPLFLMLPVAVSCSYAFMLPAASPSNAIAFETGHMTTMQMAKPGFIMNLLCCSVQLFMINTLGVAMFNLNEFPPWADHTLSSAVSSESAFSNFTNVIHVINTVNATVLLN